MKGNIIIAAALATLLAGCTTDGTETGSETTTVAAKTKTLNYTAWACEGHSKTVTGGRCQKFHSAYGPGRRETRRAVQNTCPGNCEIIFVRQGCIPLTLDNRKVLRPKC